MGRRERIRKANKPTKSPHTELVSTYQTGQPQLHFNDLFLNLQLAQRSAWPSTSQESKHQETEEVKLLSHSCQHYQSLSYRRSSNSPAARAGRARGTQNTAAPALDRSNRRMGQFCSCWTAGQREPREAERRGPTLCSKFKTRV